MMRYVPATLTALFIFAPGLGIGANAAELCRVTLLIATVFGADGPLENCKEGDVVRFLVDTSKVSTASLASRYCNFAQQIMTEPVPNSSNTYLVCQYQWKWAKESQTTQHPDKR
jgi:hypothetical protein